MPQFCVGDTNMLVPKNAKICVTPKANANICITPNASRCNIGGVGSPTPGAGVGHVHFMFFVLISFEVGSQREPSFQWNMGLRTIEVGRGGGGGVG